MAFHFLDPGPLVDGELELVAPDVRWVDPLLDACAYPSSASDPGAAAMTRGRAIEFLRIAPAGRQQGNPNLGRVPTYHFWMRLLRVSRAGLDGRPLPRRGEAPPPIEMAGGLGLRIGDTPDLD